MAPLKCKYNNILMACIPNFYIPRLRELVLIQFFMVSDDADENDSTRNTSRT